MTQPGKPSARGEDWLGREIQDLKRQLQELRAANVFGLTGINPEDGGTSFDGYVHVNGPMTVAGTLTLPAGIISNDALVNPVSPGSVGLTQQNFATTTTGAAYAQASIAVPPGYTQALVMNGVSAGATNSRAVTDFLYVAASINGVTGGEQPSQTSAGAYGSGSAFAIRTLTGLTGGSITVECGLRTGGGAWAAAPGNTANVNALILFLK